MSSYELSSDYFLPPMGINPDTIVAGGIGGGSFMSSLLHVIFSDIIQGAILISGGPYTSVDGGEGNQQWYFKEYADDQPSQYTLA